jgi:hypothetical protein
MTLAAPLSSALAELEEGFEAPTDQPGVGAAN